MRRGFHGVKHGSEKRGRTCTCLAYESRYNGIRTMIGLPKVRTYMK